MASTNDIFLAVATDNSNVVADQAKLATDSTQQTSDQAALVARVNAKGPQLVHDGAGKPFALLPNPDGTIKTIALGDGTEDDSPPVNPPAGP